MVCSVIAIDGPAGVGKTTIAKKLSKKMNAPVLFSGQLYRAVAYEMIKNKISVSKENKIIQIAKKLDMSIYSEKALYTCLLYTSPSPRDMRRSRMPSSA